MKCFYGNKFTWKVLHIKREIFRGKSGKYGKFLLKICKRHLIRNQFFSLKRHLIWNRVSIKQKSKQRLLKFTNVCHVKNPILTCGCRYKSIFENKGKIKQEDAILTWLKLLGSRVKKDNPTMLFPRKCKRNTTLTRDARKFGLSSTL